MDFLKYFISLLINTFWNPNNWVFSTIGWFTLMYGILVWGFPQIKRRVEWINKYRFKILGILICASLMASAYTLQHTIETDKNQLQQQIEKQKKEAAFYLEFNDMSLTGTDASNILLLGVTFISDAELVVDNLVLKINGQRFKATDWSSFKLIRVHTHNYQFDLDKIRAVSNRTYQEATFIATVGGVEHESIIFRIDQIIS